MKKTILLDLDGVLNEYKGNYIKDEIPDIKEGAKEFLKKLYENYEIKIFTTRNKLLTSKWLIENEIDCYIEEVTNTKDPSFLIIDDRCITFEGDYTNLIQKIKTKNKMKRRHSSKSQGGFKNVIRR